MTWDEAVKTVAKWFESNVNTYQGSLSGHHDGSFHWRDCSLLGVKIQDDCGGYVSACLYYAGIIGESNGHTQYAGPKQLTPGDYDSELQNAGFVKSNFKSFDALQPFDIIAGNKHTEIYAGKINGSHYSYSWGSIHNLAKGGMPSHSASKISYSYVWRLNGGGNFTATVGPGSVGMTGASGAVAGGYISNPLGIDSSRYTSGKGSFSGTEWGKPIEGGTVKNLNKCNSNKKSTGVIIGSHIRQK